MQRCFMPNEIADRLEELAREAGQLVEHLEHYWHEEGVSELRIFIDPDLYQYLDRLYRESYDFAVRCQELAALAAQLRGQGG